MSVSKLFTPRVRLTQSYATKKAESDAMCLNPPTHAEIPVFNCPTTVGGFPLRMTKTSGAANGNVARRPISSKSDHGTY